MRELSSAISIFLRNQSLIVFLSSPSCGEGKGIVRGDQLSENDIIEKMISYEDTSFAMSLSRMCVALSAFCATLRIALCRFCSERGTIVAVVVV